MRFTIQLVFIFMVIVIQTGCKSSSHKEMTPEQLYESCTVVFKRKGGPSALGEQMCASMKEACAKDPSGSECKKAHRMVKKG